MPSDRGPGLAFRLPVELNQQLRTLAATRGVSVTAIVEEILHAYAKRGVRLTADETVMLVIRPDPNLLQEAREVARRNRDTITAIIRAGIEHRINRLR